MTVTPSTLTDSTSTPANEAELWEPSVIFQPDWSSGLAVESTWRTDIVAAQSAAEQRRLRRPRPRLVITNPMPSFKAEDLLTGTMAMYRSSDARALAPLWTDQAGLTAAVSASATVLNCDTTYRRLSPGARVLVYEPSNPTRPETWEVGEIDSLTDSSVTLTAGLTNSYTAAGRVAPLIEAEVGLSQSGRVGANHTGGWTWVALERVGPMSLEPTATPGSLPTGFDSYDGLPIFAFESVDWVRGVDTGIQRPGKLTPLGLAEVPDVDGPRAALSMDVDVLALDREEAWAIKRLFDSRGGRAYPLWACTPMTYTLDTVGGTTRIDVAAVGESSDWGKRPYMFVTTYDGTTYVREIDSVTRNAGVDEITLTTAISPQLADTDIRMVGWAVKARFATDSIRERWVTDEHMSVGLSLFELPVDYDVTVSSLGDLTTVALACGSGSLPGPQPRQYLILYIPSSDNGDSDGLPDDSYYTFRYSGYFFAGGLHNMRYVIDPDVTGPIFSDQEVVFRTTNSDWNTTEDNAFRVEYETPNESSAYRTDFDKPPLYIGQIPQVGTIGVAGVPEYVEIVAYGPAHDTPLQGYAGSVPAHGSTS